MLAHYKRLHRNDVFKFSMMKVIDKIITLFATTFLSLYFFKLSEGSMIPIAVYNMFFFATCLLVIFSVRNITKGKNKMLLIRTALILYALCFVVIAVMKENIIDYVWFMGILLGGQHGLYYAAANPLESEKISNKSRTKYLGIMMIVNSVVSISFPLIFGSILTKAEYYKVSIIVAIFVLLAVFYAFLIKSESTNKGEKTQLRDFLNEMKKPENKPVRIFFWAYMLGGLTFISGAMSSILTIITYDVFDTNMKLGTATSILTALSIITGFTLSRYVNANNRNKFQITAFISVAIAILIMAFYTNATTIIIYCVANALLFGFVSQLLCGQFFNFINHKTIKDKYKIEFVVITEIWLHIGRLTSFTIMILASIFFSTWLLQIVIVGFVVSLFISVVLSCIIANMLRDKRKEILIFDCDGTITRLVDNCMTELTYNTIKNAQEKYIIIFATGRNMEDFKKVFKGRETIGDYAILNDGCSIYSLDDGKLLFNTAMKKSKMRKLVENLKHCKRLDLYNKETVVCFDFENVDLKTLPYDGVQIMSIRPTEQTKTDVIVKELQSLNTGLHIWKMKDSIRPNTWVNVNNGMNKGKGIEKLLKLKGYSLKKTTCFGDSYNDISMFNVCHKKIAVANAEQELKNIATQIIGTNEQDAVAGYVNALL